MKYVLGFIAIVVLLLESSFISLPLTLVFILLFFIHKKHSVAFTIAFILGLLLDVLFVRQVGLTSLFFVIFLFLVSLYDRKYEIKTWPFVLMASFSGALMYALVFEKSAVLFIAFVTMIISLLSFMLIMRFSKLTAKKVRY